MNKNYQSQTYAIIPHSYPNFTLIAKLQHKTWITNIVR